MGKVWLVGGGPGAWDLLTLRGRELVEGCEALVYDHLVAREVLGWLGVGVERYYVGKRRGYHSMEQAEIGALLVGLARAGKRVVRLKGGDVGIFGRMAEEMAVLRAAGVPVEVVPGVTAASGCAAVAGVSLTQRGVARSVTFVSGHREGEGAEDWGVYGRLGGTLVIYMGMANLGEIVAGLRAGGKAGGTPVLVVQAGTTAHERRVSGCMDDIVGRVAAAGMGAPAVVLIGEVVAGAG